VKPLEILKVTIKKWVFVVPLDFQRDNTRIEGSAVIHDM
jgi:hypothetical protein